MGRKKVLIISTLVIAIAVFAIAATLHFLTPRPAFKMNEASFPAMGKAKAPVEVVLIEDFQCRNCRIFSNKVIPKIYSEYIQAGKVRFVLVPVAFLAGSQLIGNAALEVHKQNPKKFFPYLKKILSHEGEVKKEDLLKMAAKIGGIQIEQLSMCIDKGCHNQELEKNLNWARERMGGQFRTPALYINGSPGSTFSFEAIQYQINQILGTP